MIRAMNMEAQHRKKDPVRLHQQLLESAAMIAGRDGIAALSLNAVAREAGVSKGGLIHHFPNKQALIYALNQRYLDALAEKIEATCRAHRGIPIDRMIGALIDTYWRAKTERADVTRALYRSVADMDNAEMIEAVISNDRFAQLDLKEGETLVVRPRRLHVFVDEAV